MTEHTISSYENDHKIDLDESTFKAATLFQNNLLLSLIYFGLVLFISVLVWNHVESHMVFIWQGYMIAISAARWLSTYNFIYQKNKQYWNGILISLTLLDGLGWGIAGALLFPANSTLAISLVALFLIGVGGVGAVLYSTRMFIAIPYLLSVVLPYITRLFFSDGNDGLLIACSLGLLTMLFCFAADRLNQTLNSALGRDTKDRKTILALDNENQHLASIIDIETNRSENLQQQITNNSHELENVHSAISQYIEDLRLLAGTSLNLLHDLESLKKTNLDQTQHQLIIRIEENALHLSDELKISAEMDQVPNNTLGSYLEHSEHQSSGNKLVLIVDNDKTQQKKIEDCLRDLNLDYESVENVPAALAVLCEAQANNRKFDIAIANLWMPEMDGMVFAECLQDDPEFMDINIIMLNSGEMPAEKRMQDAGINLVIKKPFRTEDLSKAINDLAYGNNELPASLEALVDDAINVSTPTSEQQSENTSKSPIIDRDVINNLRSSTATNFIEIINDFLEEAPQLLIQAKETYEQRKYSDTNNNIRELRNRSIHMGATRIVGLANAIEEFLDNEKPENVIGMLESIDAEFIQVESALLAELTNGALLTEFRH